MSDTHNFLIYSDSLLNTLQNLNELETQIGPINQGPLSESTCQAESSLTQFPADDRET